MNLFDAEVKYEDEDPVGYRGGGLRVWRELGAEQIAFNLFELPPGEALCPYHYEPGQEEWIIVLSGRLLLRAPDGEQEMGPWDCYFCPDGEAGGHKTSNPFDEPCRFVIWSNVTLPGAAVYPDSGKVGVWPPDKLFRLTDAVDYYDGEL
ncbi:MAG TPA: cupin domain-containing protein [Gaiellaceae bacterium]